MIVVHRLNDVRPFASVACGQEPLAVTVAGIDRPVDLTGCRVLFVHGSEDRVAPAEHARLVARTLARQTEVEYLEVPGGRHAMLRHGAAFERAAARFAVAALLNVAD